MVSAFILPLQRQNNGWKCTDLDVSIPTRKRKCISIQATRRHIPEGSSLHGRISCGMHKFSKTLGARRVTGIKFHNQDPQILGDLVPGSSAPVCYSVCYIPNRVILLTLPVGLAESKELTIRRFRFYDFSLTLISY